MRIMITSHFSPRTRLTMASRMLINEVRLSLISLTSFKHQLSEQLTDYCTCTQPTYNLAQTTTSFPTVLIYLFCSFAPHYFYFYFAHSSFANLPFQCFTCYIVFTFPPWPFFAFTSLISPHLLTPVYTVLLTVCLFYSMCNSVLLYVSNCFALSWPGRNCK